MQQFLLSKNRFGYFGLKIDNKWVKNDENIPFCNWVTNLSSYNLWTKASIKRTGFSGEIKSSKLSIWIYCRLFPCINFILHIYEIYSISQKLFYVFSQSNGLRLGEVSAFESRSIGTSAEIKHKC